MPQPETAVKRAIRLRLERLPYLLLKSNPQQGYGIAGVCDMDGCWEGDYLAIEVKRPIDYAKPNHALSEVQVKYALRVLAAGGLWMVVCSAQQAWDVMQVIRSRDYLETTAKMLNEIRLANQEKWSAKHTKHMAISARRRAIIRPKVQERLAEERAQAELDRQLDGRFKRRFAKGKVPIPFDVLVHGLGGRPTEET